MCEYFKTRLISKICTTKRLFQAKVMPDVVTVWEHGALKMETNEGRRFYKIKYNIDRQYFLQD